MINREEDEMMERWLKWAMEIQSLAQAGLTYTRDIYDKERYERLREISAEILAEKTGVSTEKVKTLFCNETGYQTPKLDTRAAIFKITRFYWSMKTTEHGPYRVAGAMF